MSIVDVEFKKNDEARAGVRASDNVRVTATGAITFELSIKVYLSK